jgi:hypothetical protein
VLGVWCSYEKDAVKAEKKSRDKLEKQAAQHEDQAGIGLEDWGFGLSFWFRRYGFRI